MDVSEQLKILPTMGKAALCKRWQEVFSKAAPKRIRKELMVRMLAYKIQEQAFGGLSSQVRRRLDQIAESLSRNPDAKIANVVRAKPGTRLIRSWQGKTYTVTIEEQGYQYQGKTYRSLSEIARQITGTRWSGPLFFGLKSRSSQNKEVANGR
jgi:hypothetical protein